MDYEEGDTGKMLINVQERLAGIKETLSGLNTSGVPQLALIDSHISRVDQSIKQETQSLLSKIMSGETVQDLRPRDQKSTLKKAGELALRPSKTYINKSSLERKTRHSKTGKWANEDEMPTIAEDDITKGMLNLINRGIIPKDVDLTPAFERGAPPLSSKPASIYSQALKPYSTSVRPTTQDIQAVKVDFQNTEKNTSHNFKPQKSSFVEMDFMMEPKPIKMPEEKNEARNYDEIMDTFSLHHFIIRKGITLDTPEFASYKRTFTSMWPKISQTIEYLEAFLYRFAVPKAVVDGKKLNDVLNSKPSEEELLDCIVNKEEVRHYIHIPRIQFKGPNGKEKAAMAIQRFWRGFKTAFAYKQLKFLMSKAKVIQRAFRTFLRVKKAREQIANKFSEDLQKWKQLQEKFKSEWTYLQDKKRVEIHISSLSIEESRRLTMDKFLVKQNLQISRIFRVQDPNITVVYVSAFEMSQEVINYYLKILEKGGVQDPGSRLNFVFPDLSNLPTHLATTKGVLYSPSTIKRLKNLVKHTKAYIVPGPMTKEEVELAVALGLPIYAGDPHKSQLFSTKSGSKRVLSEASIPLPPGAFDIYDEKEFLATLTRLICNNPDIETWIFKIDNELAGRGHAFLDVGALKPIKNLKKGDLQVNEEKQARIYQYLLRVLPSKVKIAMPNLYTSWKEYLKEFVKSGGVIEAGAPCLPNKKGSVSVVFCVNPDKSIDLIGAFDKLESKKFVTTAYSFPQKALPNMNFKLFALTLGSTLYEKDILGYVCVDLVSFPDDRSSSEHPLFWAVDLNCHLNAVGSVMYFFDFLMQGNLDETFGNYDVNFVEETRKTQERNFLLVPFINYPGISRVVYKNFFYMAKLQGVSFDFQNKKGTNFLLADCLQSSVLGLISTGKTQENCVKLMLEALSFVGNQGNPKKGPSEVARDDFVSFPEIVSVVKQLQKKLEKSKKKVKKNLVFN